MLSVLNTLVVLGGWLGAAEILLAYVLVSSRRMRGDSLRYQALNVSGSFLVMLSCVTTGAWSSVIINLFYLVVGVSVLMTARRADVQRLLLRTARLPHGRRGRGTS